MMETAVQSFFKVPIYTFQLTQTGRKTKYQAGQDLENFDVVPKDTLQNNCSCQ